MEIQEFINFFAAQFDDTAADTFKAETKFRDIEEWSSLIALSIIAMVDEEYNLKLTGDDIRQSKTINDVFNVVKSKL